MRLFTRRARFHAVYHARFHDAASLFRHPLHGPLAAKWFIYPKENAMSPKRSVFSLLRMPLFSLALACIAVADAGASDQEEALTWTADDTRLVWGPCPPFMPQGCGIAVLHGDPAKNNVDVFLKVPGKSRLPMHWHTSAERMVLVAGELRVTYENQKTATLKPGTYAFGPAKRKHEGACVSDAPCVLFIAFESPLDAVAADSANK